MHYKSVSVIHTVSSTTVTNQHTRMLSHSDLHMQYKIVSVLHTVSSTTVTCNQEPTHRCVFYRSLTSALSTTRKGLCTPPRWHLWPLGWHKPNHTHMPDTPVNCHLSPPPPNTNSGRPTEPKADDPRLICLGRLQPPHCSTLLHAVFSHIYFVQHDDEISTSATCIIISLLEPTL